MNNENKNLTQSIESDKISKRRDEDANDRLVEYHSHDWEVLVMAGYVTWDVDRTTNIATMRYLTGRK